MPRAQPSSCHGSYEMQHSGSTKNIGGKEHRWHGIRHKDWPPPPIQRAALAYGLFQIYPEMFQGPIRDLLAAYLKLTA